MAKPQAGGLKTWDRAVMLPVDKLVFTDWNANEMDSAHMAALIADIGEGDFDEPLHHECRFRATSAAIGIDRHRIGVDRVDPAIRLGNVIRPGADAEQAGRQFGRRDVGVERAVIGQRGFQGFAG